MGKVIPILLLVPYGLFCLEPIHSEVAVLGYGSATTSAGINGFNPAGLSSLKGNAFLINSDKSFSYNYLALGFDLRLYGAIAISLSSINIGEGLSISWGRWILPGFGSGIRLGLFRDESLWNFNGSLGAIYRYSHRFTIGGWLEYTTGRAATLREEFILGGKYRLNPSTTLYGGGGFSSIDREFNLSIGIEYLIHKHYKLMVGGGLNSISIGFAASFTNNWLGFGSVYNLNQKQSHNLLTYIHSFRPPLTGRAKPSREKPPYSQKRRSKLTQKIREKQRQYLDLGVEYYRKEKYQQAIEAWQKVVDLYPDNDLALKAQEYIRGVEEMLKRLKEIKGKE